MRSLLAGVLGAALLCGCASRDLIVVIPEHNGHVGAVQVEAGSNQVLLNKAYAAARPGSGGVSTFTADDKRVNRIFGRALGALPAEPTRHRLYFKFDQTELVPESRAEFENVFVDVASRPAPEIVVTGHTDTMGNPEDNDRLSLERARAVAELFAARGIPRDTITIAGRGSRELLVPTGDQVPEQRNRRVEITVR